MLNGDTAQDLPWPWAKTQHAVHIGRTLPAHWDAYGRATADDTPHPKHLCSPCRSQHRRTARLKPNNYAALGSSFVDEDGDEDGDKRDEDDEDNRGDDIEKDKDGDHHAA